MRNRVGFLFTCSKPKKKKKELVSKHEMKKVKLLNQETQQREKIEKREEKGITWIVEDLCMIWVWRAILEVGPSIHDWAKLPSTRCIVHVKVKNTLWERELALWGTRFVWELRVISRKKKEREKQLQGSQSHSHSDSETNSYYHVRRARAIFLPSLTAPLVSFITQTFLPFDQSNGLFAVWPWCHRFDFHALF